MHTARTLHQRHIAWLQCLLEPAAGRFGIRQKKGSDSASASGSGQMLGVAAHAGHHIQPGLSGGASAGGV